MKKFSTILAAMAMMSTAAFAQSIEVVSVTPAQGTVSELSAVTVEFKAPDGYELELASSDGTARVMRNGMRFSYGDARQNGNSITWTFAEPIDVEGTYEVVIEADCVEAWTADYSGYASNDEIRFNYTIGGSSQVDGSLKIASIDPAEGKVTELSTIRIEFEPNDGYMDTDIETSENMTVTKDGKPFTTARCVARGSMIVWTLAQPATEPGTYVCTIEDWSLAQYPEDGESAPIMNDVIELTYTIEAASENDSNITVDPVPGEVESLSTINLYFNVENLSEVEVVTAESMTVTHNGATFTTGTVNKKLSRGNLIVYDLAEEATEPGTYIVTIEESAFDIWTDEYANEEMTKSMEFIYTIVGEAAPEADEFTFDPAPGVVEKLDVLTLKMGPRTPYGQLNTNLTYNVTKNGAEFTTATVDYDGATCTLTLEKPATEKGTYVLSIPAHAIVAFDDNWDPMYTNNQAVEFTYTIEGAATVVYDLTMTKSNPAAGDVNVDDIQFESFIIYTNTPNLVYVAADKKLKFASANPEYEYEVELAVKRQMGSNIISFITSQQQPKYNGAYTLTIPKGTFGDEEWSKDPTSGHSNEEIVINYNFSGLRVYGVTNDLMPYAFTPEENVESLSVITMTLPGVAKVAEGAKATLSCVETRYEESVEIGEAVNGVYTFTFPEAKEIGTYTLIIPKETFFNAEYVETEGKLGATNDVISQQWSVSTVGIELIDAEGADEAVYTLTGVKVNDTKNLAPGIYVRNGKKVVVKK